MNGTQITIVGNLTEDPELRFTPSGVAVAKFSVAVNRRTKDASTGEWKDADADFYLVSAWRGMAENVAESLQKGTRVVVVGDLRQRTWKDEKTGENRRAWDLNADSVGADLTWATAKVTRKSSGGRTESAPDDPWSTASTQRPAGAPAAGGYSDEPPF